MKGFSAASQRDSTRPNMIAHEKSVNWMAIRVAVSQTTLPLHEIQDESSRHMQNTRTTQVPPHQYIISKLFPFLVYRNCKILVEILQLNAALAQLATTVSSIAHLFDLVSTPRLSPFTWMYCVIINSLGCIYHLKYCFLSI